MWGGGKGGEGCAVVSMCILLRCRAQMALGVRKVRLLVESCAAVRVSVCALCAPIFSKNKPS